MPSPSELPIDSGNQPVVQRYRPSARPVTETIVRFDPATKARAVVAVAGADRGPVKLKDLPAVREFGGRQDGPEPTRFGDWEKNGRCIDF